MSLNAENVEVIKQEVGQTFWFQRGRCCNPRSEDQCGFTLVEMVTVMVIVGILAVAVVPRLFDSNTLQASAAADQVAAALRYGQKVAIAQHRDVNVNVSSGNPANCGTELTAGDVNCVVSNSVSVTSATFTFDALGRPVPNAAAAVVVGSTTINIEAETGYAH